MYHIRNGRKRWRTRWPWRHLFPLKIDDRFCRECGQSYHNGPLPTEVERFTSGNVSALIYPSGNWGMAAFVVRFGRWKAQGRAPYLSEYLVAEDLPDLARVTKQAYAYVDARSNKRRPPWRSSSKSSHHEVC